MIDRVMYRASTPLRLFTLPALAAAAWACHLMTLGHAFSVASIACIVVALGLLAISYAIVLGTQLASLRGNGKVNRVPVLPGAILLAGAYFAHFPLSDPGRWLTPDAMTHPVLLVQFGIVRAWCVDTWMLVGFLGTLTSLALWLEGWPLASDGAPRRPADAPGGSTRQSVQQVQDAGQITGNSLMTGMPEAYRGRAPRVDFRQVLGYDEFKKTLIGAASEWRLNGKNGILLHGAPGGGKTLMAEALAGDLKLKIITVNVGNMASMWINETTQNLAALFAAARAQAPCVLLIDEIDGLLRDRMKMKGVGYEEHDRIVATFLAGAVELRAHRVLLIGATNFIEMLDPAAIREGRFDFKLEIPLPDAKAREYLIAAGLKANHCDIEPDAMQRLVRRWAGFNVPRIREVTERACSQGKARGISHAQLTFDDFYRALRSVQGRRGGAPEGALRLDAMFLEQEQAERLKRIAAQLVRVDEIERRGGTLPKGIVFYGPPGTGKTAAAMALAAECGWTFLQYTGRDLMDEKAIAEVRKSASDLRPAIVFIDEADDILGNRAYSGHKSATNELLTLIDGAGGMLVDVVWIAATNDIESMDSAALRAGRFEQKLRFGPPGREPLRGFLRSWATGHAAQAGTHPDAWVDMTADVLAGQTMATVKSVLQLAINQSVVDTPDGEGAELLHRERLEAACREILPDYAPPSGLASGTN